MTIRFFAVIVTAVAASTIAAAAASAETAEDGLSLTMTAGAPLQNMARLAVSGESGRYSRLTSTTAGVALKLSAGFAQGAAANRKIVQSTLSLKSGTPAGEIAARDQDRAAEAIELDRTFAFAVAADSDAARSAIAACNALPASEAAAKRAVTIAAPVLWRVTTGRFTFRWTDYDHVTPSEDIVSNPDFYGERETAETEVIANLAVDCTPLAAATAAAKPAPAAKPAVAKGKIEPANFAPAAPAIAVEPDRLGAATSEAAAAKLQCSGGMVRQIGAEAADGYACLCPGNTSRVETGDNAFACQRRVARK